MLQQHTPKFGIRHFILLQGYDRENPKSRRSGKFHRRQPESEKHLRPPMRNNGSSTACKSPSGPPAPPQLVIDSNMSAANNHTQD